VSEEVFVVCGWAKDHMDVIGVFTDENEAYQVEALKCSGYQETRVVVSSLDDKGLLKI